MEERLQKALDFVNYTQTLSNQLHKLKIKTESMLLIAEGGGKFTINQQLICFLDYIIRSGLTEVTLLDENIPHYLFLLNNKHNVDILTQSRCGINAMRERLEQLNIRKGIEYIDLIKTRTKKVEYQYSVFFDDNPQMVYDIQKYPSKYLLLFDCPWNASIDSNEYRNVFRIHEWHNILEKIEMIEKICK